jgi:hypothetical protein
MPDRAASVVRPRFLDALLRKPMVGLRDLRRVGWNVLRVEVAGTTKRGHRKGRMNQKTTTAHPEGWTAVAGTEKRPIVYTIGECETYANRPPFPMKQVRV